MHGHGGPVVQRGGAHVKAPEVEGFEAGPRRWRKWREPVRYDRVGWPAETRGIQGGGLPWVTGGVRYRACGSRPSRVQRVGKPAGLAAVRVIHLRTGTHRSIGGRRAV